MKILNVPRIIQIALSLALGLTVGCHKSVTIEYVIPNGYTGIVKLKAEVSDGIQIGATNGRMILVFPPTGTLELRGKLPTLAWHKPVARFADGSPIPILGPPTDVPDEAVAFRRVGKKNNNSESWYLVGKADQMQDAMNKFYGFQVPRR